MHFQTAKALGFYIWWINGLWSFAIKYHLINVPTAISPVNKPSCKSHGFGFCSWKNKVHNESRTWQQSSVTLITATFEAVIKPALLNTLKDFNKCNTRTYLVDIGAVSCWNSVKVRQTHGSKTTYGVKLQCETNCALCRGLYFTPQTSKTVLNCDQKSTVAACDEENRIDKSDRHETNYTNLMEGKIGIGGCVNELLLTLLGEQLASRQGEVNRAGTATYCHRTSAPEC